VHEAKASHYIFKHPRRWGPQDEESFVDSSLRSQ